MLKTAQADPQMVLKDLGRDLEKKQVIFMVKKDKKGLMSEQEKEALKSVIKGVKNASRSEKIDQESANLAVNLGTQVLSSLDKKLGL